MAAFDRLANPAATYGFPELPLAGPYGTMYPQVTDLYPCHVIGRKCRTERYEKNLRLEVKL